MAKRGRKRKLDNEDQAMVDWERDNILPDELRDEMETMWEIPQICHFLHLTKEALNINHLSMYEMERMLLMPRASKQLAHIMTCLLSSPIFKAKLRRIPPMPYEYWTNILMHKIKSWFKMYYSKHEDSVKVLEVIGVEPDFWKVFPDVALVEGKDFEELTFRQRVWLLKTVCDTIMHTRKTVQDEMAKQEWEEQFETVLGTDRHGAKYVYFPQFIQHDVRVYRHCLDNTILSTVKPPEVKVEPKIEVKVEDTKKEGFLKSRKTRRRKSRWQNGSLPPRIKKRIKKQDDTSISCKYSTDSAIGSLASEDTNFSSASVCSNNNHSDVEARGSKRSRSSSKNSEESIVSNATKCSHAKSSGYDTNTSNDAKSYDEMPLEKMFRGFPREVIANKSDKSEIDGLTDEKMENERTVDTNSYVCEAIDVNSEDVTTAETNPCDLVSIDSKSRTVKSTDSMSKDSILTDTKQETRTIFNEDSKPIDTSDKQLDEKADKVTSLGDNAKGTASDNTNLVSQTSEGTTSEVIEPVEESSDFTMNVEEVSNSSKTDDEKLNEIMSIDVTTIQATRCEVKRNGRQLSKVLKEVEMKNTVKVSSVSKSDDEKLIETKSSGGNTREDETIDDQPDDEVALDKWMNALSKEKSIVSKSTSSKNKLLSDEMALDEWMNALSNSKGKSEAKKVESVKLEKSDTIVMKKRKTGKPRGRPRKLPKVVEENDKKHPKCEPDEPDDEDEPTLSELRDRLLRDSTHDNDSTTCGTSYDETPIWERYNFRKPKKIKKAEPEILLENFDEMLSKLSVSTFELVADSVDALRDLEASFIADDDGSNDNREKLVHSRPQCEVRLAKRILELVESLSEMEPMLDDATKKARVKLHKEWTNFKEGVVEDQDQDWSSEGILGLGSNSWVLGSQGVHPMPPTGDAAVSSLSQPSLSSLGAHHPGQPTDDPTERPKDNRSEEQPPGEQHPQECSLTDHQQSQSQSRDEQKTQGQTSEDNQPNKRLQEDKFSPSEEDGEETEGEEPEQQSRRVLRARGVSSYTEQLYSDEDAEEDELEGWPDVEAVTAAPCTPTDSSVANAPPSTPAGQTDAWDSEDSDQDWILPGSRKRKNKRPSANRRLKSFQHKLQNIRMDSFENTVAENATTAFLQDSQINSNRMNQTVTNESQQIDSNVSQMLDTSGNSNISSLNVNVVRNVNCNQTVPLDPICKIENVHSVHSELDIKEEGRLPDTEQPQNVNNYNLNMQQGYVVVKTEHGPMTNFYLMQPNPGVSGIVQQNAVIPNMVPQVRQSYYVQNPQNFIVHGSHQNFVGDQASQMVTQQSPQMMLQQNPRQQMIAQNVPQNYMQMQSGVQSYVVSTGAQQNFVPSNLQPPAPRGFFNPGLRQHLAPTQNIRMSHQQYVQNRPSVIRNNPPYPNGAVIRSNVPIRGPFLRNNSSKNATVRPIGVQNSPRMIKKVHPKKQGQANLNSSQKTTSLIVLSDSDDEIEMIITEKTDLGQKAVQGTSARNSPQKKSSQPRQKPVVTSEITVSPTKSILPPQIMQRMSQGGISITPVKPTPQPVVNPNTQLVVVVNETGSHYALALPNGSKLILTPDQVAQIRASNGGKLIL